MCLDILTILCSLAIVLHGHADKMGSSNFSLSITDCIALEVGTTVGPV